MRLDALLWYCVAYLLVALHVLCSAEASQWLQQRVQVLVKSLQVQHRQWGARRSASQQQQQQQQQPAASASAAPSSTHDSVAEDPDGGGGGGGAPGHGGGGGSGGGGGVGAGEAGDAAAPGAARGATLAGRLRLLRQYTGPDGPAPLRRLKQRLLSALSADARAAPPPPPPQQEAPASPARLRRSSASWPDDLARAALPADAQPQDSSRAALLPEDSAASPLNKNRLRTEREGSSESVTATVPKEFDLSERQYPRDSPPVTSLEEDSVPSSLHASYVKTRQEGSSKSLPPEEWAKSILPKDCDVEETSVVSSLDTPCLKTGQEGSSKTLLPDDLSCSRLEDASLVTHIESSCQGSPLEKASEDAPPPASRPKSRQEDEVLTDSGLQVRSSPCALEPQVAEDSSAMSSDTKVQRAARPDGPGPSAFGLNGAASCSTASDEASSSGSTGAASAPASASARELAPIAEAAGEGPAAPAPAPPCIVLQRAEEDAAAEAGEATRAAAAAALLPLQLRPPLPAGVEAEDPAAPARKSPVTVQEWVDSLPITHSRSEEETDEQILEDGEEALDLGLGAEAGLLYNGTPVVTVISPQHGVCTNDSKLARRDGLAREPSVQSDVTSHGSHGSSVESYLESRKPDPEEVLLSLGFGGPVSLDSEVTRIPRRFLQPSKVKGVAIKDFLRHQQELIENFETGFCGYRGLTGSSGSMPSVIVAKIMEKLREHERDSVHSAATSEYASFTTPPPDSSRRLSHHSAHHHHHHHHRHMLKRGSGASSSSPSPSSRQNASLSVLNADNRRFLESQGSKSPEVPRKRMIIGQRSFTFGRDGDLIELESSNAAGRINPNICPVPLPPLKPLVHKDSVLSSATDLSLTSVDSDSDTDERSETYELHRRLHVPPSPLPSIDSGQIHASTPFSDVLPSPTNLSNFPELEQEKKGIVTPITRPPGIGKRMSSTSLSSWESDTNSSPTHMSNTYSENSFGRTRFTVESDREEYKHKSSHSLLGHLPLRYQSIEEDIEMKTESDASKIFNLPLEDTPSEQIKCSDGTSEYSREELHTESKYEDDDCVFTSVPSPCATKVPINEDVSSTQLRRGSLKRQQNVAEEDAIDLVLDPHVDLEESLKSDLIESPPNPSDLSLELSSESVDQIHEHSSSILPCDEPVPEDCLNADTESVQSEDGLSDFERIILPQLEIIDECLFKKEYSQSEKQENRSCHLTRSNEDISSCPPVLILNCTEDKDEIEPPPLLQVLDKVQGDSFEMEEIGNGEIEAKASTLFRARSDSSGFLEGDVDRSEGSDSKVGEKHKVMEENSTEEQGCTSDLPKCVFKETRLRGGSTGTGISDVDYKIEHLNEMSGFSKRLSLPVVRVVDESGGLLLTRSNSLHSISSDDTNSSNDSENVHKQHKQRKRRVKSAPEPLALASSCSSVSNMFSSCSDESVIHIDLKAQCSPIQPTAEGIASTFRTNRDLQELLEELAVRGVILPRDFDPSSFSSQPSSQCAPLQADAVRAALNTYSSQLGESMNSLQRNSELLDCVVEARHELEIVRDIREQIAAELRRVASLLEEQPGPRAAAITRQMTVLLREQTRLCRQLEALSQGYGPIDSSFAVDNFHRTFSATNTLTAVPCCNSERLLGAVREENRRLERLVQGHSQELAEIRHLLKELLSKQN